MRSVFILLIFLSLHSAAWGQSAKHVILISIDGLRPEFYKDPAWATPNLQQMMREGVYAEGVKSVFPTVTFAAHTTIITGVPPAKHGIYYNLPFEPEGQSGNWYWEENLIRTETLWDAAKSAGLTIASVNWPVTVGAPIDYNIPVIRDSLGKTDQLTVTRPHVRPQGLLEEIEENETGKLQPEDFNSDFFIMDENIGRMATYIIRKYQPALTAIHLIGVDHVMHAVGREGDKVRQAVGMADRIIGSIVESVERAGIKESTAFIITGDHGFVDIHSSLAPNVWLSENGLIGKSDWKARFHTSGAAAFLYPKDRNDENTIQQVKKILEDVPAAYKKLFRIVSKEELKEIGADPEVVLALAPIPGITLSGAVEGEVLRAAKGGTHGYFPDFPEIETGFIGYGAGFNQGRVVPIMGLEDIAPIIAQLLDINFETADGVLLPGILKGD